MLKNNKHTFLIDYIQPATYFLFEQLSNSFPNSQLNVVLSNPSMKLRTFHCEPINTGPQVKDGFPSKISRMYGVKEHCLTGVFTLRVHGFPTSVISTTHQLIHICILSMTAWHQRIHKTCKKLIKITKSIRSNQELS